TSTAITAPAPRCKRQSVKPPVEAPTSSAPRPATSTPEDASALASLIPPRETYAGACSTLSCSSASTSSPGLAARRPCWPTRTSPAITEAAARLREGNRPRSASRLSRRRFAMPPNPYTQVRPVAPGALAKEYRRASPCSKAAFAVREASQRETVDTLQRTRAAPVKQSFLPGPAHSYPSVINITQDVRWGRHHDCVPAALQDSASL